MVPIENKGVQSEVSMCATAQSQLGRSTREAEEQTRMTAVRATTPNKDQLNLMKNFTLQRGCEHERQTCDVMVGNLWMERMEDP